jgi:alpha-galactosidase/6-phospho-beta-glucosidase family protein
LSGGCEWHSTNLCGFFAAATGSHNRTNINVQELIVEAALTGRKDAVYHAVMLDPLTAAVCTLPQIHNMATEMLLAQQAWLPYSIQEKLGGTPLAEQQSL